MSLQTRKELLMRIQARYKTATKNQKKKILDEFIATTSYQRKYAITLLNQNKVITSGLKEKKLRERKYDEATRQALISRP